MLYTHNKKAIPSVRDEEFLPSISNWISLSGIFIVGTVIAASALSFWVKYNVTVKAVATVRPLGEVRLVQPEIEGTVKSILVEENQIVKQGDVIAHLDTEQLKINKSQLQGNIQQGRLKTILIDVQIKTVEAQITAENRVKEGAISSAKADLVRNKRDYQEQQITTQSELLAAEASLQKAEADLQKAQADLDFAKIDRERYEQLTRIGAISRREFEQKKLVVEQTKSILKGQKKAVDIAKAKVKSAKATVNPTSATVLIAQERIGQETAKGEANIATLNKEKQALMQRGVEIQTQLKQYQKELQQIETQLQNSIIRATSDGTCPLNHNLGKILNHKARKS